MKLPEWIETVEPRFPSGERRATVLEDNSVAAALTHLEQTTPDAIISDIAMPTQDGIDLVRQVRALDIPMSNIPIVALTAFTSDDDRRRILGAGFNAYLSKPLAPLELMRTLAGLRDEKESPP